jgi:hypothetical protein
MTECILRTELERMRIEKGIDVKFESLDDGRIWYTAVYPCLRRNRGHTHHVVRSLRLDEIIATVYRRGGYHRVKNVPSSPISDEEMQCRIACDPYSPSRKIIMMDDLNDLRGDLCTEDKRITILQRICGCLRK